jgi:hypothetical protein
MPFYRLAGLQASVGIPLPVSTQWKIVSDQVPCLCAAFQELLRQAARGDVFYQDDTNNRILELMGKRLAKTQAEKAAQAVERGTPEDDSERRGIFTSGIVATCAGHRIALFFTGRKHAGENLLELLAQRAQELGPPIQMCDPLSRNMPAELKTIVSNCLAHGRRQFADVAEYFHQECRHVLEALAVVYHNDALARERGLSPEARLQFHQAQSTPVMDELHAWLTQQIEQRLVEPNSGLQDRAGGLRRRHVPELHSHERTLRSQSAGLPDGVAAARAGGRGQPGMLDALELPADARCRPRGHGPTGDCHVRHLGDGSLTAPHGPRRTRFLPRPRA